MSFFDLTDQAALITGAATGIGEAVARRLALAGATVAVADIDVAGAERAASAIAALTNGRAFAVAIDVSDPVSVNRAYAEVIARTGKLEIVVNNAGIGGKAAPLWEQTLEDWHRAIAINMDSVFSLCRAAIVQMRQRRYGRIVNIASIAGKEGNPNMTAYSATKAAVIGFTKSLAKEVATEGICVNAVAPAVVRTRILEQLTQAQIDYMCEKIPMRRTGMPEEIAAVVHFLASPDCSFVTGQCYDASGGRATY
jgi:NAD(P)-dependent dehydrogenase (short-subunit alcohol dehydrogenase family)